MASSEKISFIGGGKMATAIALGLVKSGVPKSNIKACDISKEAAEKFEKTTGVECGNSMQKALRGSDIVILAVKPQFAPPALEEAKKLLAGKLLVSIAAGLTIDYLVSATNCKRVIRVMPNTPALVGEGMTCFASAPGVIKKDVDTVRKIFEAVGRCRYVGEHQLDAVTGLSGSGPAYVLEFIMGLADGGVYCGIPRDVAIEMAAQTVLGAAAMVLKSGIAPAELRDGVISPAGTTARGVMVLQEGAFKGLSAKAVIAGAERSAELSGNKK